MATNQPIVKLVASSTGYKRQQWTIVIHKVYPWTILWQDEEEHEEWFTELAS